MSKTLQELVDNFNVKYGDYAGARYRNQDRSEEAAFAARALVVFLVQEGQVNDSKFAEAYKKAQEDERRQDLEDF